MYYEKIIRALNKNKVKYAVVGGRSIGYRPKVAITKEEFIDKNKRQEWIKKKGMVMFPFFHLKDHLKLIDMFITEPIKFSEIEKKLEKIKINNLIIPMVSIGHLKKLKLLASRPKDLDDVKNLQEIEKLRNEKSKSK
jgi:hypothetical protein